MTEEAFAVLFTTTMPSPSVNVWHLMFNFSRILQPSFQLYSFNTINICQINELRLNVFLLAPRWNFGLDEM